MLPFLRAIVSDMAAALLFLFGNVVGWLTLLTLQLFYVQTRVAMGLANRSSWLFDIIIWVSISIGSSTFSAITSSACVYEILKNILSGDAWTYGLSVGVHSLIRCASFIIWSYFMWLVSFCHQECHIWWWLGILEPLLYIISLLLLLLVVPLWCLCIVWLWKSGSSAHSSMHPNPA